MKDKDAQQIIALAIAAFLVLIGMGGCGLLWDYGDSLNTKAQYQHEAKP